MSNSVTALRGDDRDQIRDYRDEKRVGREQVARTMPGPSIPSPAPAYTVVVPGAGTQPVQDLSPATDPIAYENRPRTPEFTQPAEPPKYTAPEDSQRAGFHRFGELGSLQTSNASPLDAQDNLRRVTFTAEGADFDIELDPAGKYLAYASTRHRHTADIYLQKTSGTAVTQLTTDPANDVMPCISPNGKQVAFASDRSGTWDIYLMEITGGQAIKLTSDGAQNIHPSFSPDGSQLVYSSYGSQSGVWELVLIDLAAPSHRRVIGHGLFPVWNPVNDTIVFQRARERGSRWFSIWTVQIKDGEAVSPTEIAASSNAAIITPEWSPDGRSIVFCTVMNPTTDSASESRADIWVCNADGSGRARLTHGSYGNLQPTWAADGTIYFISDRGVDGIENVYAVRPDQAVYLARQRAREPDSVEANVPTDE